MTTDKNPTLRHAGHAVAAALAFALLAGCAADGSKSAPNMLSEDGKKDRERALREAVSSGKPQMYRDLTVRPVP